MASHLAAVSTNLKGTAEFGISSDRVFGFWDFVGGRYSVWSAVGAVPLSLVFGFDVFREFLRGGNNMDTHLTSNLNNLRGNIPILLGLLGYYNIIYGEMPTRAILPYSQALCKFPNHVQQLDMESNGKQVSNVTNQFLPEGSNITGPVVFGEAGTNGQHSFYQLIHQGRNVACEFIGIANSQCDVLVDNEKVSNHEELMSNFFAQPDALALGKFQDELKGTDESLVNHKTFVGDKPSLSFLFKDLNAFSCGQLLSIYEHRVATEGFLFEINSFDQWGVELGKVNATEIRNIMAKKRDDRSLDIKTVSGNLNQCTVSLLERFFAMKKD